MKQSLRELPILSVVFKNDDILGPTGSYAATSAGNKPDLTKPCSLELLLPDGTTGFAVPAGIDIHGNASREPEKCPKHGFTLRFKGTYGTGKLEYPSSPNHPPKSLTSSCSAETLTPAGFIMTTQCNARRATAFEMPGARTRFAPWAAAPDRIAM
jgi:hypothetical protein